MLDGSTSVHMNDVDRLAVDIGSVKSTSSPPDPCHSPVGRSEEIFDGALLMLVGGMVDPNHVCETFDTAEGTSAQPLMVEVVRRDDFVGR